MSETPLNSGQFCHANIDYAYFESCDTLTGLLKASQCNHSRFFSPRYTCSPRQFYDTLIANLEIEIIDSIHNNLQQLISFPVYRIVSKLRTFHAMATHQNPYEGHRYMSDLVPEKDWPKFQPDSQAVKRAEQLVEYINKVEEMVVRIKEDPASLGSDAEAEARIVKVNDALEGARWTLENAIDEDNLWTEDRATQVGYLDDDLRAAVQRMKSQLETVRLKMKEVAEGKV